MHFCLNEIYPSCKRLFTDALEVPDASMRELMSEAVCFQKQDGLEYIRSILLELEKFLVKDETYTVRLTALSNEAIWPVREDMETEEFDEIVSTDSSWFIPDTKPLQESFYGKVPLLAFPTDDISQMERLITYMELDNRRLSRAVQSIPRTQGRVCPDRGNTATLQSKYEFIAR